jgi:hypothetical protein
MSGGMACSGECSLQQDCQDSSCWAALQPVWSCSHSSEDVLSGTV